MGVHFDYVLVLGGMGNSILVFDMIVTSRYTGICMLPLHGCLEEALPVLRGRPCR